MGGVEPEKSLFDLKLSISFWGDVKRAAGARTLNRSHCLSSSAHSRTDVQTFKKHASNFSPSARFPHCPTVLIQALERTFKEVAMHAPSKQDICVL